MSDLKLSEAIRLGSMLHPQCFGNMSESEPDETGRPVWVATCALGAAMEAGCFETLHLAEMINNHPCPVCGPNLRCLDADGHRSLTVIAHLNDTHRWTREAIADWVQTVEEAEAASTDHNDLKRDFAEVV
jgi:hypothetical protein